MYVLLKFCQTQYNSTSTILWGRKTNATNIAIVKTNLTQTVPVKLQLRPYPASHNSGCGARLLSAQRPLAAARLVSG